MSEIAKTTLFLVLAGATLGGAYVVSRGPADVDVTQQIGEYLNADIDVGAPKRLRIVKFDRETAAVREFEVAEVDGTWSIPSKSEYPADAARQMAQAATCVIDRKILRVAANDAQSHEDLGVVDPLSSKLNSKSTGVGTRVIMSNADDTALVDMIIGKAVKDAAGQRYVRRSNQDVVYVVELDPANLSTDFNDWIEKDLLKINPFDITKLFVNDYSADLGFVLTPQGVRSRVNWDRRNEMTLTYDNSDAKWQLADIKKFDSASKDMVEEQLAEGEEVNQDALGQLRTAIDDLAIVDVVRKPEGLSADLKAGEDFLKNPKAFEDLISKGFSPVAVKSTEPEILASEGEVIVTLRDGVEYVLRFGQLQVQTDSAEGEEPAADATKSEDDAAADADAAAADADKKDDKKDEKQKAENLRRYLFVMARFNEDAIQKPQLKDLPALPADGAEPSNEKPTDEKPTDEKAPDDQPAGAADEQLKEGEDPAEGAKPEEKKDEAQGAADDKSAELDQIIAERKSIEAENQRLLDEYQETIKAGKKKVTELNERFGDWYYVISNDVYKKIHVGRDTVIKKSEAKPADATGADDALSGLPDIGGAVPAAQPATETPAADQPATEQPATERPATEQPAAQPSDSEAAPDDAAPAGEPPAGAEEAKPADAEQP